MINIFQPEIPSSSLDMLSDVFDSNWLGRGKLVSEFESLLSKLLNAQRQEITTMSCCSDAIFAILPIIKKRSSAIKVLVPSISFPAIGSAVINAGLELVLVDVEADTGNISLDAIRQNFDDDVLAIFITHYGGNPVDVMGIREIVGSKVFILEDSACALGSVFDDGTSVGLQGDFACWSFDAMKLLVAGEGGAARIPDQDIRNEFKETLYLGLPASEKSGLDKVDDSSEWWSYELNSFGSRSVFTDVNAAIAIPQFDLLNERLAKRQKIRELYVKSINASDSLEFSPQTRCSSYSNYFFTVLCESRNELAFHLKTKGVYSTFRYYPLNKIDLFARAAKVTSMEGSDSFSSRALNIPIHSALSDTDVDYIARLLAEFK
jgi:dTDP-4-amino-4,6-dideoxygalactose transaminase